MLSALPLSVQRPHRTLVRVLLTGKPFPGPQSTARISRRIGLAAFASFVAIGLAIRIRVDPAPAVLGSLIALSAGWLLFLSSRATAAFASVATAGVIVVGNGQPSDIGWFALIVIAAWCVIIGGVEMGLTFWGAAVLVLGGEWLWARRDPGWAPWCAGLTVTVLFSFLLRHQFVLVERLRTAQADLAQRSRAEERNRIARELHDIIAHSLTVSLLHVTSARLALEVDPSDAARALEEAEELGRQSLSEVRATMGLLRSEESGAPSTPAPGVGQIAELVSGLRRAGADISLLLEGALETVPATIGSCAYRIVQEALTNSSKHARGSKVVVSVRLSDQAVHVDVDSSGAPGIGTGMGVDNMQERARAVGGLCTAGPGGSGWLVQAKLPLTGRPAESK